MSLKKSKILPDRIVYLQSASFKVGIYFRFFFKKKLLIAFFSSKSANNINYKFLGAVNYSQLGSFIMTL